MINALVLGVVEKFLSHAQLVQLSLTEVIALSPGAQAQFIHRDELLFDAYPFDNSYEVYCNYTEEMGATRIVPGSHKLGSDRQFDLKDTVPAEMPRGSVLIYSGKLYHGGGGNKTLPEDLLRLMGYASAHGYGLIGDRLDPLTAITPGEA